MIQMPKQLYILGLVLLCYLGPWSFIGLFPDPIPLVGCIAIAHGLCRICNAIVLDPWIVSIILIELICMCFNATLFLFPVLLVDFHAPFMRAAFIIELLIIAISLRGEQIGGAVNSASYRMASLRLCGIRNFRSHQNGC